ncbi:MAG: CPBP family intramembrane metalloprotease [Planctomycetia bacterium]|nr:CPBP family intramembrane metalloprotease [Planctomycetia bacterium]
MYVTLVFLGLALGLLYTYLPRYALRPLFFVRENLTLTPWSLGVAILLLFYVQIALPVIIAPLVKPIGERLFPEEEALRPRAQQIIPLEDDQIVSDPAPNEEKDDSNEVVASTEPYDSQKNDEEIIAQTSPVETEDGISDQETESAEQELEALITKEESDVVAPTVRPTEHPLARLLIRSMGAKIFPLILTLFIICVCVLAPLSEELCYRVVLQSAVERGLYDLVPEARKLRAVVAVIAPALFFALLHFNTPEDQNSPEPSATLFASLLGTTVMDFIILLSVPLVLRKFSRASLVDLGLEEFTAWRPGARLTTLKRTFDSFLRGVCYLLLIFVPVQIFNIGAQQLLPNHVIAPIPIFLFAIFQGVAYMRGRSYAYIVGAHVALNSISTLTLLSIFLNWR